MSETRERFPYRVDREVIDAFLMGNDLSSEDSYMTSHDYFLRHGAAIVAAVAGASVNETDHGGVCIYAQSPNKTLPFFIERIANYMLEALGSDERLTREINTHDEGAVNWRWVYEGKYISPNEPIVLCGEMTLMAYRASRTA